MAQSDTVGPPWLEHPECPWCGAINEDDRPERGWRRYICQVCGRWFQVETIIRYRTWEAD